METYLAHHGILGMKWGVRRYQNEDGSLTAAGKERYGGTDSAIAEANSGKSLRRAVAAGAATVGAGVKLTDTADTAIRRARQAQALADDTKYASIIRRDGRLYFKDDPGFSEARFLNTIEAMNDVKKYGDIARAATTVASIVSGVGAVATISYGAISAGQLAYSAYLKHKAKTANQSN